MNLLEHYIEQIHCVTECNEEWTKEFPGEEFVTVDLTYNCYGNIETSTHVWNIDQWDSIKQKGYFMG